MSDEGTHFDEAADDFLMSGGIPSAKFPTVGTEITGTIDRRPEVQQQRDFDSGESLTWDDGKPRQQLKVVLRTDQRDPEIEDDEGLRAIYVKANLLRAVRQAVRKSGAKGLEVGGRLTVTYTQDGENKRGKGNPPKLYSAVYEPPSDAAVNEVLNTGDPESEQPAAQQTPQQPAGPNFDGWTPEQISAYMQAMQAQQQKAS